jgi:hypothetical protein
MKSLSDRRESLKRNIKDGVKEVKAGVKEHVKHLPDGHRGSMATVTERPMYRPIPKETQDP